MPSAVERLPLELRLRRLTVERVEELSASLRRVALGGPDVAGFVCHGPTDHAKVFFPEEPDGEPALPTFDGEGRWTDRQDPRYVCRDYSVRTFIPGATQIVLDMAVHEHGPAGRWAAAARPGRTLGLYGPKTSKIPPLDRGTYLLAADETGLPALTSWLERLADRPGRVHAVVEVDGPADEVTLLQRDGVQVTWLHRSTAPAGTTTLLADALAGSPLLGTAVARPEDAWVWAAGEADEMRAVRRAVAEVDRSALSITGYWRRGVANFDHKAPVD